MPRLRALDGLAVHLHAADAGARPRGKHLHLVACRGRPAPQRARDHGARPLDAEGAVDGQTQEASGLGARRARGGAREGGFKLAQPFFRAAGDRHDLGVGEGRPRQARAHLVGCEGDPLRVCEVDLGESHDARAHAEEVEHGQVLFGLGHDAIVGRDAQKREVDARRARYHPAHEALVARHVHDAERRAVGQLEAREAQLDGDAARLLLGQTVGVHSGEGAHERRLPVVDVARRAQDEVGFGSSVHPAHAPAPSPFSAAAISSK